MTFGSTLFETTAAMETVNQPNITQSRLDSAYESLHSHVPGSENLPRITKLLRKHGLEVSPTNTIQQLLTTDRQFFLKTVPPISAKGLLRLVAIASLYDLKVYYFSTRKTAQILNPKGTKTVAILHHVDSYLGNATQWFELKDMDLYQEPNQIVVKPLQSTNSTPAATPKSRSERQRRQRASSKHITQDEILLTFKEGIKRHHRDSIHNATKDTNTKKSTLAAIQLLQKKVDRSKSVPHVYDEMQRIICQKYPDLNVNPSFFSDRMKSHKKFDRVGYYKEEGNALLASVGYFFEHVYDWDNDDAPEHNATPDDSKEEEDVDIDQKSSKSVTNETITLSLRSILRSEIDYTSFLAKLEDEQFRVGRCMSQLSKAVKQLTTMIINGDVARICGRPCTHHVFDLHELAPNFVFKENVDTSIKVTSIPDNIEEFLSLDIYTFSHFSNLLSGCVGSSVHKESKVFKDIREAIINSNTVEKQSDFMFNGAMNNGLREFNGAISRLWTRQRHDRDLRVVLLALLRINLAPLRTTRYLNRRIAKRQIGPSVEDAKGDVSTTQPNSTIRFLCNDLAWSMMRNRGTTIIDQLLEKIKHLQTKVSSSTLSSSTPASSSVHTNPEKSSRVVITSDDHGSEDDSSTKAIKALVSIIKRCLDKNDKAATTAHDVKATAYQGTELSDKECEVASTIANALRPLYKPKVDQKEDGEDELSVFECAPLAAVTNMVVKAVVPQQNEWALSPAVDPRNHAIHLSADVVYTLFSSTYTIPSTQTGINITSKRQSVTYEGRQAVFQSFFDMAKIDRTLGSRKLRFNHRITFVDMNRMRLLGWKVKKSHGVEDVTGTLDPAFIHEQQQQPAERRPPCEEPDEKQQPSSQEQQPDEQQQPSSQEQQPDEQQQPFDQRFNMNTMAMKRTGSAIMDDEVQPPPKRSRNEEQPSDERFNKNTMAIKRTGSGIIDDDQPPPKRSKEGHESSTTHDGDELRSLISNVERLRRQVLRDQEQRASLASRFRKEKTWNYELYGKLRAAREKAAESEYTHQKELLKLSRKRSSQYHNRQPIKSEETEDWGMLQNIIVEDINSKKPPTIIGIDPGLVVAATSTTASSTHISATIDPHTPQSVPIPPYATYTHQKKNAAILEKKHHNRHQHKRAFRTREIRHHIFHQKFASRQRIRGSRNIIFAGQYKHHRSRIKGHRRGATSKLLEQLNAVKGDSVHLINEHRTSKTCPVCHEPAIVHKYSRQGVFKKTNGAIRCTNAHCPQRSRNTFNRDHAASYNIAVRGFSIVMSTNHQPATAFAQSNNTAPDYHQKILNL